MNDLVDDARAIFDAAVAGVQPDLLLRDVRLDALLDRPLDAYRRVVLVGAGKAAMATAGVLEARLGDALDEGVVVVPHGYRATLPASQRAPQRIEVVEAGHPVPDEAGVEAAQRVLDLAHTLGADDLLVVALSGGGSALWPAFGGDISLKDAQQTFRLLLHSGADIHAVNTVRRHLSRIGGGKLARAAAPAYVLTLVISDVVGDDLTTIASGPTVPDPTTFADALAVLYRTPAFIRTTVWDHLKAGAAAEQKSQEAEPELSHTRTVLVGTNRDALAAAHVEAERRGYAVRLHPEPITGEAREVGRRLAGEALNLDVDQPTCLLWGGETTVTVTGGGRGGRNQEVALAAALELDSLSRSRWSRSSGSTARDIVFLSGGTDGIDGPTDAAGAWVTSNTVAQARTRSLDGDDHLTRNDAYPFLDALGQLLRTGPTHTNVMDVQVALVRPRRGLAVS